VSYLNSHTFGYLKIKAPLWKKERTPTGERWVASRCSDNEAAERWQE